MAFIASWSNIVVIEDESAINIAFYVSSLMPIICLYKFKVYANFRCYKLNSFLFPFCFLSFNNNLYPHMGIPFYLLLKNIIYSLNYYGSVTT